MLQMESSSLPLLLLSRFSHVWLCATPETAAHQAPPSLEFSRQKHWNGLPFPSPMHENEKWKWSRSVMSNSSWPHGLQPTRLLRPWDFPGKSTGVGCHCLLQIVMPPLNQIFCRSLYISRRGTLWSFQGRGLESPVLATEPWLQRTWGLFWFLFFWPYHTACWTLVSSLEIEPVPHFTGSEDRKITKHVANITYIWSPKEMVNI